MMGIYRNWSDPQEYKFRANLWPGIEEEFWAWEFLRRNIDYQKDWKKELNFFQRSNPKLVENAKSPFFFIEPQKINFREKWGIYYFVNPMTDNPDILFFDAGYGRIYQGSGNLNLKPGQVAVVFNLERPIIPQFKQISRGLKELKRRFEKNGRIKPIIPRKYNRDNWSVHLQVLDAKAQNIVDELIPKILFPNYSNKYPDYQGKGYLKKILFYPTDLQQKV